MSKIGSRRGRKRRAIAALLVLVTPPGLRAAAAKAVPFANPAELASSGGVLSGRLTQAPATLTIAGKTVTTTVYNGEYVAPLLRVQPGDRIRLELANETQQSTNIHYHGLAVTPLGPGDNVFLDIAPATTFRYDFRVPVDHAAGLFWYHPHFHPDVNPQIAAGLSGGMIVGDILAPFPALAGITERVILLKDLKLKHGTVEPDPDPAGPTRRTINGLYQPRIDIAPGELQFWRIGNIGANIYYKLKLPGYRFAIIAQDGNLKNQIVETKVLEVPPAARYEVLVRGAKRGKAKLKALKFGTGPQGDHYPAQVLATVVSSGPKVTDPIPFPASFPPVPDLRQAPVNQERTITFADADSRCRSSSRSRTPSSWASSSITATSCSMPIRG